MSRAVKQPVGQKRLTNIAVVRLKKAGRRFEIACYRNKVNDWRSGIEKDLDEVLQTTSIFSNVGKGIFAKQEDLQEAFGTTDDEKICLEILAKGELQVSDKERRVELDVLFKDIVSVLVDKTVNPQTSRPYTHTMLERALKDLHFNPDTRKSAKQQALEVLPQLQSQFPIQRARMRLRLQVGVATQAALLDMLRGHQATIESCEELGGTTTVITQVEPGVFRELHNFMQASASQQGRIEVLSFAVTADGAGGVDDFGSATAATGTTAAATTTAAAAAGVDRDSQPVAFTSSTVAAADAGAAPAAAAVSRPGAARRPVAASGSSAGGQLNGSGGSSMDVLYPRGPIAGIPEEYAARRERFAELDQLQPGWAVELRQKGEVVDAAFFSPEGKAVGAYANARRQALQAHKQLLQL